jgi:hypothetical protein
MTPAGEATFIALWTQGASYREIAQAVKAQASTEGKEPSHLVQELLWKALTDHSPSTP